MTRWHPSPIFWRRFAVAVPSSWTRDAAHNTQRWGHALPAQFKMSERAKKDRREVGLYALQGRISISEETQIPKHPLC